MLIIYCLLYFGYFQMFVRLLIFYAYVLASVYGTCQSVDGQRVPWWILYQQKDRPFFHQYVDSTNSHRIKVTIVEVRQCKNNQNIFFIKIKNQNPERKTITIIKKWLYIHSGKFGNDSWHRLDTILESFWKYVQTGTRGIKYLWYFSAKRTRL